MAELIPVGLVRAQRFIALHLIANAGKPVATRPSWPVDAFRANLAAGFRIANLSSSESNELSRALAYLAYNMTCSGPSWRTPLDVASDWTFHVYKRPGGRPNRISATLLPKAFDLWKRGVETGVLSLSEDSVSFCQAEARLFFCAQFILGQPLDPAHLRWLSRPPFADAWTVSAVVDPKLPGRLEAILRTSRHARAPLWAARVLNYIGDEHVSQLFWAVLGGEPGPMSNSRKDQPEVSQEEPKIIAALVRNLFTNGLVQALRQGDSLTREHCGHLLRNDKEVLSQDRATVLPTVLVPLLNEEQPEIRIEAGATLLTLNAHLQPLVGSAMLGILNHADPTIRWAAAIVMARADGRRAVEPLLEAVKAGSHRQWGAAIQCLGRLGDPRAVPALIDVLRDPTSSPKGQVIHSLALLHDRRAVTPLIRYAEETTDWESTDVMAIDALGWLGDDRATDVCLHALASRNGYMRSYAAQALGRLGSNRAVPALIQALRTEQYPDARMHEASAMGELRDLSAVDVLIEALNWNQWPGRIEAARALGMLGGPRAVEALLSALEDSSDLVACTAASGLANLRIMEARIPIISAIEAGSRRERWNNFSLMLALGQLDSKMAVEYLVQILSSPSDNGHASAIMTLGRLGQPEAIEPLRHYVPPAGVNTAWRQKLVLEALSRLQVGPRSTP